uniref:Uncharacterized protein n=1 Tax=Brassica oleracea var. oleracea TaxID=109376 RepID=A0A0D3D982_BRAOL
MVLILHLFKGFSDLEDFWDVLPVSRLKYNALDDFQKVFQTTSRKSSRRLPFQSSGLPGSPLTKSPFHNRSEHFGFSDLEDFWDVLPVSRLKYNALDDFQKVFQTTSRKSSRRLPFQSFFRSGFNMQIFQIWKTSGTTYLLVVWKSSGLLGNLLTKSSGLPGSHLDYSCGIKFFRSGFNMQVFQIWKTSGTTYLLVVWKSSGLLGSLLTIQSSGLPGSRLTKSFSISSGVQAC